MPLFVDTSILIHDFMHRQPDVAAVRNVVPAHAEALAHYRAMVHHKLMGLAQAGETVHTTSAVLWRMAALLTEWFIPPQMARIELQYLLSNYVVHEVGKQHLEETISTMGKAPTLSIDEMGWQLLGKHAGINTLLTCQPLEADSWLGWQILKPEEVVLA
jgi:hypothetical protein